MDGVAWLIKQHQRKPVVLAETKEFGVQWKQVEAPSTSSGEGGGGGVRNNGVAYEDLTDLTRLKKGPPPNLQAKPQQKQHPDPTITYAQVDKSKKG